MNQLGAVDFGRQQTAGSLAGLIACDGWESYAAPRFVDRTFVLIANLIETRKIKTVGGEGVPLTLTAGIYF